LNLGKDESQRGPFLRLKEQVPEDTYETRLKGTVLLYMTDLVLRILVPSTAAFAWLERRLYWEISQVLRDVLHPDVDVQFVTSPLATPG
jgi:chromosomal replication initiation ATPase DnaA